MESETQVLHASAADGISTPSSTPTPESTSLAHQPFANLASLATSNASGTTTTSLVSRHTPAAVLPAGVAYHALR
ncbi:hypothetical protein BBO_05855 [Beauveria brongniartii RCEF 3172]|uniref:Uncharacterized protein n=1 Tax=Beauveria brongniartii RCEF 3172 TaxID=1081107 RepID=A0A162J868_9HYPO|nr:hypothetical protein BBO_05855 [Beauveria brongniartii RCEF 3172]